MHKSFNNYFYFNRNFTCFHAIYPVFGSFSYHVFLECERDWFAKQSNERIPKKRWKFTYEPSPVFTHRCIFTSFRIVFLNIEEIKRFPFNQIETSRSG